MTKRTVRIGTMLRPAKVRIQTLLETQQLTLLWDIAAPRPIKRTTMAQSVMTTLAAEPLRIGKRCSMRILGSRTGTLNLLKRRCGLIRGKRVAGARWLLRVTMMRRTARRDTLLLTPVDGLRLGTMMGTSTGTTRRLANPRTIRRGDCGGIFFCNLQYSCHTVPVRNLYKNRMIPLGHIIEKKPRRKLLLSLVRILCVS